MVIGNMEKVHIMVIGIMEKVHKVCGKLQSQHQIKNINQTMSL